MENYLIDRRQWDVHELISGGSSNSTERPLA